jgi:Uma2 family endonuclease
MTPGVPAAARYTAARYLALADAGVLGPEDRVELLEGVIVTMSPQHPPHASAVYRTHEALRTAIGNRALVRMQLPFVAGPLSVPEPDVAVVPGRPSDYDTVHPDAAFLVVEVADTSLLADRLTKAAIYAAAGVVEFWIVNLRDDLVEVFGDPDPERGRYGRSERVPRSERLPIPTFADAAVAVDELFPERAP